MSQENYGPISFLIGKWNSGDGWIGKNRAPDPDRNVENTRFRQEMIFEPIGEVENHEQKLYALRYSTKAWEEGADEAPFHEEVGYWIWDSQNRQVMKSFIVPRGISAIAGGTADANASSFTLTSEVGSETYGICSNRFLDEQFKSLRYDLTVRKLDANTFSYEEDTLIKIKGQEDLFHHTESNTLKRV